MKVSDYISSFYSFITGFQLNVQNLRNMPAQKSIVWGRPVKLSHEYRLYWKNIQICRSLVIDLIVINHFSIALRYESEKRILCLCTNNKGIMLNVKELNVNCQFVFLNSLYRYSIIIPKFIFSVLIIYPRSTMVHLLRYLASWKCVSQWRW